MLQERWLPLLLAERRKDVITLAVNQMLAYSIKGVLPFLLTLKKNVFKQNKSKCRQLYKVFAEVGERNGAWHEHGGVLSSPAQICIISSTDLEIIQSLMFHKIFKF